MRKPTIMIFGVVAALMLQSAPGQEAVWKAYIDGAKNAEDNGDFAKAAKLYDLALEESKSFPIDDSRRFQTLTKAAGFYGIRTLLNSDKSEELWQEALRLCGNEPKDNARRAHVLQLTGKMYELNGDHAKALQVRREALDLREKSSGARHRITLQCARDVANSYRELGELTRAEALYKQTLKSLEDSDDNGYHKGSTLRDLAVLYLKQQNLDRVEPLCREAFNIFDSLPSARHSGAAMCYTVMGDLCIAQGNPDDAASLYEKAIESFKEGGLTRKTVALPTLDGLVGLLKDSGRESEAQKWATQAKEIRELYGWPINSGD